MKGEVEVTFIGTCPGCHTKHPLPKDTDDYRRLMEEMGDGVRTSIDHRLRANEQVLRYGLGPAKDEQLTQLVRAKLEATLSILWTQLGYDHPVSREIARIWGG